jgi:hypothetical protein
VNQRLLSRLRRARHLPIAIALLLAGPSCAMGMSGPMYDNTTSNDSGATYETGAAPPMGGGEDSSSTQHPGADSSSGMYDGDDGSTGGGQDSSIADPDVQVDTGGPPPQDSSTGPQDSSPAGDDAMGPPDSGPSSSCAGPSTPAACHACSPGPSCQPNGCYNGYICNTQTNHCGAPGTCS